MHRSIGKEQSVVSKAQGECAGEEQRSIIRLQIKGFAASDGSALPAVVIFRRILCVPIEKA